MVGTVGFSLHSSIVQALSMRKMRKGKSTKMMQRMTLAEPTGGDLPCLT